MSMGAARNKLLWVVGSLLLAVTLLASGLGLCCLPATTNVLAATTENPQNSPYEATQLTRLAQATAAYTVNFRFSGDEAALNQLNTIVVEEAKAACQSTAKANRWSTQAKKVALQPSNNATAQAQQLAALSDRYALDAAALSHLNDCNHLLTVAGPILGLSALATIACVTLLAVRKRHRLLGNMLTTGPIIIAAVLVVLAAWAAVDFMGFFQAFHGLLFPQGNWTFPIDSLLITMYPTSFWMGMGAVWAATTFVLSILCLGCGIQLKKNRGNNHD